MTILLWLIEGVCPRCGYHLIEKSIDIKCARCDFFMSKESKVIKEYYKALKQFRNEQITKI